MSVTVTLPDGSELSVEAGSTVEEVAYEIGPGLGRDTVAGVVDGEFVAKEHPLERNVSIEIVTDGSDEYLDALRHSAAHVFAQALKRLHPEAKLTIGPWTDDGFYYDISNTDLDQADVAEISAEAEEIIEEDLPIERVEMSREDAFEYYAENRFKREILEEEAAGEDPVSFYEQAEFRDLCRGPHVASTGEIGGFALLEISGAYWRGSEENEMLTRVYGTAFPTEGELAEFLDRREQAKERDHRKIGREMDLFSVPDHSPGCVHFHPNGMAIRRELEEYIRTKDDGLGYEEVWTPELNKAELWKPTGHYDNFTAEGEMFVWEQDSAGGAPAGDRDSGGSDNKTEYGLKPMNCANHAYIFDQQVRSYRDLPVRFSELGTVYRNEQSGELSGLLRVRGFTQDDGHAFIREDQIEGEIVDVLRAIEEIYGKFDLETEYVLETQGENAVGSDEIWAGATDALAEALEREGLDHETHEGEAAFYGPKIGINAIDALGREWTIGTVQLDFNIPERLDLTYTGKDNAEHRPVMVHRALLGSFERFMGVMIEHFNGNFPTWLAPEQVRILPISDDNLAYAEEIKRELDGFRVGIEDRSWTIGKKIQITHDDRVPYMLIVGDDEEEAGTVSVRDRFERKREDVSTSDFRAHLEGEVGEKRTDPDFLE